MTRYTEVFKPEAGRAPRTAVFYTITAGDVGRTLIRTTAGPIPVSSFMGGVQRQDVGRRVCRQPDGTWQIESITQRSARLAGRTQS